MSDPTLPTPATRRFLFPIVWPAALVAVCVVAALALEDRGLVNSMWHAAVIMGALGWSIWLVGFADGSALVRRLLGGGIVLALMAFYFQRLPIKTINNGDVGIVGWRWRWDEPDRELAPPATPTEVSLEWRSTPHDYPAFLGGKPWAEANDARLAAKWNARPRELWKQRIGAGWSAFAVVGNFAVTQEQRGDDELISCYRVDDGEIVWTRSDPVRFDPTGGGSLGGIGPRATPTLHEGRVYAQGATGIVNCLDAAAGKLIWSCDTLTKFGGSNLLWGKAGSPMLMGDKLLIAVGDAAANVAAQSTGKGSSLVALDANTGEAIWQAGDRRASYATPVVTTLAGVEQVVVVNEEFVTAHDAGSGAVLWEHPWPGNSDANASTSQPVPVGDDRLFLSKGYGEGAELIRLAQSEGAWTIERLWKKSVMKTKMGNVVVKDGFVYGIDDVNLQCIELDSGKQAWKKRRRPAFGHGQIMLADDKLLILSEEGEVILAEANPAKYVELASFPALDGVTWNNPALSSNKLLIRNAEWAACYELPTVDQ